MATTEFKGPALSWVPVSAESHFPLQNLPYGVFRSNLDQSSHIGVAIGEFILDLNVLAQSGFFKSTQHLAKGVCFTESTLNSFMSLGKKAWSEARALLTELLSANSSLSKDELEKAKKALVNQNSVKMELPARIGDYTDFYASRNHAYNVGFMLRGADNALQPNWVHLPVGYHGRASSIVVSGTDIKRPNGQTQSPDDQKKPIYKSCQNLDFEMEVAAFIGPGNKLGDPIKIEKAEDHIFGFVLLNDWSARDIQAWEYVPLGPFNAKNFATSISPWVVTTEALQSFKIQAPQKQDPEPFPYLRDPDYRVYDIQLELGIKTADMSKADIISKNNSKYLYWTFTQQVAHHTCTGCNLQPGDLLGSGTISGTKPEEYGSLLEISWKGTKEVKLTDGSTRKFLKDGDTVIYTGYCQGQGYRIGFGSVSGTILKADPI